MRCTGVAVITSTPNPERMSSSGIVMKSGRMLDGGAATMNPTMPPAADTLSIPSFAPPDGYGVPFATCTTPRTPTTSALHPMPIRPVSACRSGCRSSRQASSASMMGTDQSSVPKTPLTRPWTTPAAVPLASRQIIAASTIAPASTAKPRPSRRWAGSSSLAPWPRARAALPTPPANSSHTPMNSLPIIVKTQLIGSWCSVPLRRAGAALLARPPDARLAGVARADVERFAGPFWVPRWVPLDVRVAMMTKLRARRTGFT